MRRSTASAPGTAMARRVALVAGAALLLHAAWALVAALLAAPPVRSVTGGPGPWTVGATEVMLIERPASAGHAYVDVAVDGRVHPGTIELAVQRAADPADVRGRFEGALAVAMPLDSGTELVIVVVDPRRSSLDAVAWQTTTVDARGGVERQSHQVGSRLAGERIAADLTGVAPRALCYWPAPAGAMLGAFLVLAGLRVLTGARRQAVALVVTGAVAGSLLAWPLMRYLSLPRTVAPVLLALAATLLAAYLSGARAGVVAAAGGRLRAIGVGAAYGSALFALFVTVHAAVRGFIAPVFRAPVTGGSPADLLVADYLAPTLAMVAVGLLPAAVLGAVAGLWLGRRPGQAP